MSFPVVCLLSDLIALADDSELLADVRSYLEPFAGRCVVVGFGLGNLGPVDRYAARLVVDPSVRTTWQEKAVEVADQSDARLWRVLTRVDLAMTFEGSAILGAAHTIARDGDLESLRLCPG